MAVGPVPYSDGNTPPTGRQGKTGEAITGKAHGDYYESASRGTVFGACSNAAVTVQTTITTTAPATLHNPVASQKRLQILEVRIAYFSGTMTAGLFYHGINPVGTTLPSGGTTLTSTCMDVGNQSGVVAVGVAGTGRTVIAATPVLVFASSFPALASSVVSPLMTCVDKLEGAIVLEPGGVYQLVGTFGGAGSSPAIGVSILWNEVPIVASNG